MKSLAIIPARAGSKRLKDKNTQLVGGTPLWAIAVGQALEAECDKVIVSTNIESILHVNQFAGIKHVEIEQRPEELCKDTTPIEAVVDHLSLQWDEYPLMCLLNPTHPLRGRSEIVACLRIAELHGSCCTVKEDWNYTIEEAQHLETLNQQARQPRMVVTGAVYAVTREMFYKAGMKLMPTPYCVKVPKERSVDIDEESDLEIARVLWEKKKEIAHVGP